MSKNIRKALGGQYPVNDLYALIPANKRKDFKRFAACFGFTEENIKSILANEKG